MIPPNFEDLWFREAKILGILGIPDREKVITIKKRG